MENEICKMWVLHARIGKVMDDKEVQGPSNEAVMETTEPELLKIWLSG